MASIAKRPDGRWRARYRDPVGQEISHHFARKVDAQGWLDSVTTAVSTGLYVDPSLSRVRVGDWAHKWLATKTNLNLRPDATTRASVRPTSCRAGAR
jgi:hypothetical protein